MMVVAPRPALAGSTIGRHCNLEVFHASQVLDDILAVIVPYVDAMGGGHALASALLPVMRTWAASNAPRGSP
jgi:hypothetical protein